MLDFVFRWEILWYILLALYIPSCIGLIAIVLLQKGKGVGFAGAFGVGSGSETVFGPRMSKTLPQRLTYIMAGLFMAIALIMSMISGRLTKGVAPGTVDETAILQTDMTGLEDLGSAIEGGSVSLTPAPEGATALPETPAAPPATPENPPPTAPPLAQTPVSEVPPTPAPEQK